MTYEVERVRPDGNVGSFLFFYITSKAGIPAKQRIERGLFMHKIGISKESMNKITSSEPIKWSRPFAIQWTGNNLKEVQELVGKDRAIMLVPPRLVVHTDVGPIYPEIGDWIFKVEGGIGIDLANGQDFTGTFPR